MQSLLREVDTIARLGGEEFVLLLESVGSYIERRLKVAPPSAGWACFPIRSEYQQCRLQPEALRLWWRRPAESRRKPPY
ncbi:MAG: hypothetical protein JKY26_02380 [Pseudomonas sp.]|nr:hypothetical protein [Pseudomonas sp.]